MNHRVGAGASSFNSVTRRATLFRYLGRNGGLLPREMKLEHTGGVKAMTDEQLERGIELIKEMIGGTKMPKA